MVEYITTRTYYSKKLDEQTYSELTLIAKRLGILRKIIWHQFSSSPKRLNDRKIRDIWLREKENGTNLYPKIIDQLPARLWKETLRDTIGNINAYFEAGFTEIIKRLYRKYGKTEAKKLAKILKTDYKSNNELHRMVRTLIPKGYSKADNIICLDEAIIKYCFIYGTKLVYVNAAYTSQGDSRFNCALMGTRIGDSFIGFDEVVLDADINAAINILARLYDSEINLYTSAEKVKEILTKRADAVLSASVETAQLGLQQVVPINLELPAKSGLSKKSSKNLAKVG